MNHIKKFYIKVRKLVNFYLIVPIKYYNLFIFISILKSWLAYIILRYIIK